ncbi:RNA/RNP complex-1-interacting phosphatase [Brachionichthys hirsutus]|uniref:RNA/RNP complex-1-interacting phosphatase n=1 Tax=Brachionichthys hirsutus TaxID=412623 RepID=UPI0036044A7F
MSRSSNRNGIPDRWLDYRAVGKRLRRTRFIAFKVPLKQSLNRRLDQSDVFGPWDLLDVVNQRNQQLGLIVDLTFTSRFYSVKDVPESLLTVKIFTRGHVVPSDDTILSFKRAVRRFLRNNSDNDKLVGVHCTHGVNRTGYLICRYLIDVDGMNPAAAINLFNSSRGHAIERQNYLQDLRSGPKRSNEGMDEFEQEPIRGCAVMRQSESDSREGQGSHVSSWAPREGGGSHVSTWAPRSAPPRGISHLPRNGLRHRPSVPNPNAQILAPQWRIPPRSEDVRSRYLPAEPAWRSRSGEIPPYSPRWESWS